MDATHDEVLAVARAAGDVAAELRHAERGRIAALLRAIAGRIEGLGSELIEVGDAETSLGVPRLENERGRTCGQLRAFADLVDDGSHLEVLINEAVDGGHPDIRRMLVSIGPVAVFGASNFPLAFSVPGGDTASALAAGCPVVAKGHPLHPRTSELCGRAITDAVADVGLPTGTFSLVQGASDRVGADLVLAPEISAVAFTGSLHGGRALYDLAATREVPIPVYAEMGSTNPVFVSAAAIAARAETIASELAGSITLGCGQFCTKPGLLFVDDQAADALVPELAKALGAFDGPPMLGSKIQEGFEGRVATAKEVKGVDIAVDAGATLLDTDAATWLGNPKLHEEIFGPAAIVVRCRRDETLAVARAIEGSLTASLYLEPGTDDDLFASLHPELVRSAGRIVFDGAPTGVAVVGAMHHGGPYPATTSIHTSVGLTAVRRFLRPVAYQNAPGAWLPAELRYDAAPAASSTES